MDAGRISTYLHVTHCICMEASNLRSRIYFLSEHSNRQLRGKSLRSNVISARGDQRHVFTTTVMISIRLSLKTLLSYQRRDYSITL